MVLRLSLSESSARLLHICTKLTFLGIICFLWLINFNDFRAAITWVRCCGLVFTILYQFAISDLHVLDILVASVRIDDFPLILIMNQFFICVSQTFGTSVIFFITSCAKC